MSKKKIIAILLFIFLGLFMFTYASPGDGIVEKDEPVINQDEDKIDEIIDTGDEDNNRQEIVVTKSNIIVEPDRVVILLGDDYDVMTGIRIDSGEKLEIKANITDTTTLEAGSHLVTYSATDASGNRILATRRIVVLEPEADEDEDGFTNKEELEDTQEPTDPSKPEGEDNPLVSVDPTDPEDEESHPETYAPVITLIGENPYIMLEGNEYEEPGYEITLDPHDKITTKEDVEITGEVDVNEVGEYELTYTITDRYGKTAEAVRTVVVKEDKNNNDIADEDENHYTVTFEAGRHGTLEGTLVYENVLTDLTFEEAAIEIPTSIANEYYKFRKWIPSEPTTDTIVDDNLEFIATFEPINDENNNGVADEEEDHYTVTFKVGKHGTLEGTLVYEDVLTDLTFEEAEIIVPTPIADEYYKFKEWTPSVPSNTTVVNGELTFTATFEPINDVNNNEIADEEETYKLTINYVYSNGNKASETVEKDVVYNTEYSVASPEIEYYTADKLVVEGIMPEEDVTVTVTYTPNNDVNNNEIADEEETYKLTINYVYSNGNKASETVEKDVVYNTEYSVASPEIEYYTADKLVVEGIMPEEDVTVTVTYTPNHDENDNEIADETEEHYTVIFVSGRHGTLEGTLVYENVLTGLTFEEAGIEIPTPVASEHYKFRKWIQSEPTLETVVNDNLEFIATFEAMSDENDNGIADENETYTLTINYVYSNGSEASETVTKNVVYNTEYSVKSPEIEYYTADKLVVEGVMPEEDVTVTVTYTPNNDINDNEIADETEEHYTVTFVSGTNGILEGTTVYSNILTGLTFEEAEITVPTPVANEYYKFKEWTPNVPSNTTVVNGELTFTATFEPITDENNNGVADEEETYKLTINYVYSNGNKASETVIQDVVYNTEYSVKSPEIEYYTADKLVVEGVMPEEDVTVTVTYTPNHDENDNEIADETEEHYTVTFVSGTNGTLQGTTVYSNILTGLTFEEAGIIVPTIVPNEGYISNGWDKEIVTTVTGNVTYTAQYLVDQSKVQTGIEVSLKPNTQLQFQVNSNANIKDYLIVNRVFADGSKEEITDYTTDFTTSTVGENITLTVTDGKFTNTEFTYDITEDVAYTTRFTVDLNITKSYLRYIPNYVGGWTGWDYNDYTTETITTDHDFLEIKETYDENIEVINILVTYTDDTTQTVSTVDNEFEDTYSTIFGTSTVDGSTNGIRWDKYEGGAFYAPVYKTIALTSTNIKYVDITYERRFSDGDRTFTIRFENRNGNFVAISEIEL